MMMAGINPMEMAEMIMAEVQKKVKELKRLNVMILGKTGVGKSTLINNMFSEHMADTGIGKPVTKHIRLIEKKDYPLAIYDTPGLELSGDNDVDNLLNEVKEEIDKGFNSGDVTKAIHCIWYCIATPSHRFEDSEIAFLKQFYELTKDTNIPVIVILTQSFKKSDARALKATVEKENLAISAIVPVLAEDYIMDEDYPPIKAYGLEQLSDVMYSVLPETVQKTFVSVGKRNLQMKQNKSHAIVAAAAASAAITGALPIPGSDAAFLIPEEIGMLAGITAIFGLPIESSAIAAIVTGTIGTAGATILGKTIVANLLKLIPGAGSAAGGAISASTAAALTAALGEAYIGILTLIYQGKMSSQDLGTAEGQKVLYDLFKEKLLLKRKPDGSPVNPESLDTPDNNSESK